MDLIIIYTFLFIIILAGGSIGLVAIISDEDDSLPVKMFWFIALSILVVLMLMACASGILENIPI